MSEGDRNIATQAPPGYRILEYLGGGGMGEVYKALHLTLDRLVALKVAHLPAAAGTTTLDGNSLLREARVIARLDHPHIVRVYDCLEFRGQVVMVLEYLDGFTLEDLLLARELGELPLQFRPLFGEDGLLRPRWVTRAAVSVAEALQYAHARGVYHLDIKPSNIFVTRSLDIKLLDFNIAHDLHARGVTQTGTLVGSPPYMSPEQIQQQPVDGRSDLYSLGCVLYHILTGQLPYDDTSQILICIQHLQTDARDPHDLNPALPQGLRDIIVRLMEKDPERRFASAAELRSALVAHYLASGAPSSSGVFALPPPEPRRRPVLAYVLVAGVVVLAPLLTFPLWRDRFNPPQPVAEAVSVPTFVPPPETRDFIPLRRKAEGATDEQLDAWIEKARAESQLVEAGVSFHQDLLHDPARNLFELRVRNDLDVPVEVSCLLPGGGFTLTRIHFTDRPAITTESDTLAPVGFGSAFADVPIIVESRSTASLQVLALPESDESTYVYQATLELGGARLAARLLEPRAADEAPGPAPEARTHLPALFSSISQPLDPVSERLAALAVECLDSAPRPRSSVAPMRTVERGEAAMLLANVIEIAARASHQQRALPPDGVALAGVRVDPMLGVVELDLEVCHSGMVDLHCFVIEGQQDVTLADGSRLVETTRPLAGLVASRTGVTVRGEGRIVTLELPEVLLAGESAAGWRHAATRAIALERVFLVAIAAEPQTMPRGEVAALATLPPIRQEFPTNQP